MRILIALLALAPLVQEAKKPQDETALEIEITPAERPPYPDEKKFALKEPLVLEGKSATEESLRESLAKAIRYLLGQQQEDGSWRFDVAQVRPEALTEGLDKDIWISVMAQMFSPVTATSLCCTALRAHQSLAPERIGRAVEKGLAYVIAKAPKHTRTQYGLWTWTFAIDFLTREHRLASDAAMKEKILGAVRETANLLLNDQHRGTFKRANPEFDDEQSVAMKDGGATLGIVLVAGRHAEEGVLVMDVIAPAATAGIQPGDRIVAIDGKPVRRAADFRTCEAALLVGTPVKIKLFRAEGRREPPNVADGGWSYNWGGEALSFATAASVLALLDAKAIGVEIPADALERAAALLKACRHPVKDEVTFDYDTVAPGALGVRGSVSRVPLCTLALHRLGKLDLRDVESAVECFNRRRGELDKVLGYSGSHVIKSYTNAPYYFHYAHYFTARVLGVVKDGELRTKTGAVIQEALLKHQHPDGTWTDHESFGRLYGTAMAMMAMGEVAFVTPGTYSKPIPGLEKVGK